MERGARVWELGGGRTWESTGALSRAQRWFAHQADPAASQRAGRALRTGLRDALNTSTTCRGFLARPAGALLAPAVMSHVMAGVPSGSNPVGAAIDAAVLALPTLRAFRWRRDVLLREAEAALPIDGKVRIVAVNCAATLLSGVLALHEGGPLRLVCVEPSREAAAHAEGVIRREGGGVDAEVVVEDLTRLAHGRSGQFWTGQHVVVLDGMADLLPESMLAGVFAWAFAQIHEQGSLLSSHLAAADDAALLGDLLSTPLVRRRAHVLATLLALGGRAQSRLLQGEGDWSGGIVGITRRRGGEA